MHSRRWHHGVSAALTDNCPAETTQVVSNRATANTSVSLLVKLFMGCSFGVSGRGAWVPSHGLVSREESAGPSTRRASYVLPSRRGRRRRPCRGRKSVLVADAGGPAAETGRAAVRAVGAGEAGACRHTPVTNRQTWCDVSPRRRSPCLTEAGRPRPARHGEPRRTRADFLQSSPSGVCGLNSLGNALAEFRLRRAFAVTVSPAVGVAVTTKSSACRLSPLPKKLACREVDRRRQQDESGELY